MSVSVVMLWRGLVRWQPTYRHDQASLARVGVQNFFDLPSPWAAGITMEEAVSTVPRDEGIYQVQRINLPEQRSAVRAEGTDESVVSIGRYFTFMHGKGDCC